MSNFVKSVQNKTNFFAFNGGFVLVIKLDNTSKKRLGNHILNRFFCYLNAFVLSKTTEHYGHLTSGCFIILNKPE